MKYISAAGHDHDVESLKKYIEQRRCREDVLFLGIFTADEREHIGNIKYEPVDIAAKYAVLGILIGEPAWRGCGVASEVIAASARWLRDNMDIREIVLGVSSENIKAIKAYESVGFRASGTDKISVDSSAGMTMVWKL